MSRDAYGCIECGCIEVHGGAQGIGLNLIIEFFIIF